MDSDPSLFTQFHNQFRKKYTKIIGHEESSDLGAVQPKKVTFSGGADSICFIPFCQKEILCCQPISKHCFYSLARKNLEIVDVEEIILKCYSNVKKRW